MQYVPPKRRKLLLDHTAIVNAVTTRNLTAKLNDFSVLFKAADGNALAVAERGTAFHYSGERRCVHLIGDIPELFRPVVRIKFS
jgi:hypothetical protein